MTFQIGFRVNAHPGPDVADRARRRPTFRQEGIWAAEAFASTRASENLLWAIVISGDQDSQTLADWLRPALRSVVARHESLRTVFEQSLDGLFQVIQHEMPVALDVQDHRALPPQVSVQEAEGFGSGIYDLSAGPLFRFLLERTGEDTHRLLCGFHHIIMDGTSWRVFFDDLAAQLAGLPIAPLRRSTADFGDWQRAAFEAGGMAESERYWRIKASVDAAPLQIPIGRPASLVEADRGRVERFVLPSPLTETLNQTAQSLGCSVFRVLAATYAVWLSKAGQRDAVRFATTLTGRHDAQDERAIGMYVGPCPLDLVAHPQAPFTQILQQLNSELDEAVAHQTCPATGVQIGATGQKAATLLNNVPFSLTRMPSARRVTIGHRELRDERVFLPDLTVDLSVYVQQGPEGLSLIWNYRQQAMSPNAIGRSHGQLIHLLKQVLGAPDGILADLSLTPPAQRRQALAVAEGPALDFPVNTPLHRIIQAQAKRTPERRAIIDHDTEVTYGALEGKANTIARRLAKAGIKKGDLVPLLLPVGAEMIIAEYAILKLGAVFAPLDPNWPEERRRGILERLHAKVQIVAGDDTVLQGQETVPRVIIGHPDDVPLSKPLRFRGNIGPDDPVYCIFTSGSTGAPKGAINTNRGVVNRMYCSNALLGDGYDHVVLVNSTPGADTLQMKYLWPIMTGGHTVIGAKGGTVSGARMVQLCADVGLTMIDFIPATFRVFVDTLSKNATLHEKIAALRVVIIGGEAMQIEPVNTFLAMFPNILIFNGYGPSEAAISSIWHQLKPGGPANVPIGKPLPNTTAIILDRDGNVAPLGMVGELCLGGACPGLGYFDDPKKTAERFIPAPRAVFGTNRMYRTGDLARVLADGVFEFHGRADDQISLNGNRIEPGELETALALHPDVVEAAVTKETTDEGVARLVAYIVAATPTPPDAGVLRMHLSQHVPRAMVPAHFYAVSALSRAVSGKLDRKALAALPNAVALRAKVDGQRPPSAEELEIISVWSDVLRREDIGPKDDFFLDAGGDSLAAITCAMALEERFGKPIDLYQFYKNPTPEALARMLTQQQPQDGHNSDALDSLLGRVRALTSTWGGDRCGDLFCVNATGKNIPLFWCGNGFQEIEKIAQHLGPDQPIIGMRTMLFATEITPERNQVLGSYYADEIAAYYPKGNLVIGGFCAGARLSRDIVGGLRAKGRTVNMTILLEDTALLPLSGPVTMIYGAQSKANPLAGKQEPQAYLQGLFPNGLKTFEIHGNHNSVFSDRNAPALADTLRHTLVEAG